MEFVFEDDRGDFGGTGAIATMLTFDLFSVIALPSAGSLDPLGFSGSLEGLGVVDEDESVGLSPAGFAVAGTLVEPPGSRLLVCGVETDRLAAQLLRSLFQSIEQQTAQTLTLEVWAHAHAPDLRLAAREEEEPAYRHQLAGDEANEEVTARVEIGGGDVAEIVLPRSRAAMRARVLERQVMQLPDGLPIAVPK